MDAAFTDVAKARRLVGLSGASVFLATRDDVTWFVRKVAHDEAASSRLREQARRQRVLSLMPGAPLSCPEVVEEGELAGRYWFDMALVRGADGASHFARAAMEQVAATATVLCDWFKFANHTPAQAAQTDTLCGAVTRRMHDVQAKCALPEALFARVLGQMTRLRAFDALSPTLCHGDLTLENVIVGEHQRVFAIDLLDAPFEHWWLDVAKLHQDLDGGWYQRQQPRISRGVTHHVSARLLQAAETLTPGYRIAHPALLCATFMRILPYVDDSRRPFVMQRVEHYASCDD